MHYALCIKYILYTHKHILNDDKLIVRKRFYFNFLSYALAPIFCSFYYRLENDTDVQTR